MAFLLLELTLYAVKLLTFVAFRLLAVVVTVPTQAIIISGRVVDYALDNVASLVRIGAEYVFGLARDGLASLLSCGLDALRGAATESVGLTASAVAEIVEKVRSVAVDAAEMFPEAFEGLSGRWLWSCGGTIGTQWGNIMEDPLEKFLPILCAPCQHDDMT